MASFVALEAPDDPTGENTRFVRDGFRWFAFILPAVWLIWNRLWIEALGLVAIMGLTAAVLQQAGYSGLIAPVDLAISLLAGLEAPAWLMAALARRGWRQAGVVEARDEAEAELRWFHRADIAAVPAPSAFARPAAPFLPARSGGNAMVGLVPYPGEH